MKFRTRLILGLVFVLSLNSCGDKEKEVTTLYLVRHAEKDLNDTTNNPPLTAIGYKRAERLALELQEITFDGVYSTNLQRTENTVLPLAKKQNLEINHYPYYQWHELLDTLKITYQKNYLIGGHGDNLLEMMDYLKARRPQPSLGTHEYDNIFKLSISIDSSWVDVIKY